MGLAVLHGIILAHDGIIDVKSTLGKGTAFTVFFPRSIQESALEEQVTANMPSGSETILFVDDEQEIVTMRTRMLEYLGYTVLSATKPETALEYFAEGKNKIDLLITDHTMPRMTGLQLAKAALEYDKELPIILCSGYSDPITPEEAQDAGIRRFLAKPLDMRLLAIAIREILPSKPKEEV
jgi:CheY-like chemotaxis protein